MDNTPSSNINNTEKAPIKCVITIGNVSVVPLDEHIRKRLKVTDGSLFAQEITEDGLLLRPISNITQYLDSEM